MKYKLLPVLFLLIFSITYTNGFSQSRRIFAVTGDQYGSVNWIAFRQIDLD